ncbi:MAG: hypothetical protein A2Y03_00380 [Omnitrophica WOR_2 bacterium GWF2_38_59]|nr:MAG: hypothetical protein A2Y06_06470 [Omnitrophica WOR_2 bacterium GWA2_37_7]OGX26600.1 MAG: hypothetical protein A2Y03_00380 [Omnitrophica WOR_2 bacterium GWF2_38_59]OGX47725.1 MAG: hypothetical protein A2243_00270 [Omnitrophica WOR_2 bacterium RIFOXYA2_FULL_38_17]OGX55764.1 MAG: hypothetical protein A2306_10960 [Omnitrophica WOR_2 bacterium RIFOXYB2_FULL_38_16]OGX57743.1 MAG: hypothetical protein A2447_06575 [Omnitrophica WOR_2 bacterium RIFOXYC2_FULL_38_12]HBG60395.1 hypothetical protei
MSSIGIEYLREKYPGKTDPEIANEMAKRDGYVVIVRYKSSSTARDYSNFGTCHMEEEVNGYLNSPYCHDVEIIYDARKSVLRVTPEMIMAASCESCNKSTTSESLVLMGGNDFYFCPKCAKMFCDRCYVRLPLTDPSGGYGMCPDCMVEVQRAYPGAYGKKSFGSQKKEIEEMKACGSCGLNYEQYRTRCPFCNL